MENNSVYVEAVMKVLLEESFSPTDGFVRFLADRIGCPGEMVQTVDGLAPIVRQACRQLFDHRVADRLSAATRREESGQATPGADCHTASDDEFEGYFVVKVA